MGCEQRVSRLKGIERLTTMSKKKTTIKQRINRLSKDSSALNWGDLQSVADLQFRFEETSNVAKEEGLDNLFALYA